MQHRALAVDYDGTLASRGFVAPATLAALDRVRASGRLVILVTGRRLEDLKAAFPAWPRCDRIVAENGGLLHRSATGETVALARPIPPSVAHALARRGVEPLEVGHVLVATRLAHEVTVIDTVRELGESCEVTFNRDSVMVLPPGVTKASGLARALEDLDIPADAVVGIGDAENDQAFLALVGMPVAVADAVPSVREEVAWVTPGGAGEGVVDLVDRLLRDDLADIRAVPRPRTGADDGPIRIA